MLELEARALLTRLARVRPFALHETMVPAAAPSIAAMSAVEAYLAEGRKELRGRVRDFLQWLNGPGRSVTPPEQQRRFVFLRLRFNVVLSHFDVFADVLTQRSEHSIGVWLAGLDSVAADALNIGYFEAPPVVCYLDRGHGAAIRRARTRLPGGGETPVALIRVPRERMVGTGIGSSLVHEVGHQGAALLDLVNELRAMLKRQVAAAQADRTSWEMWERWISEIVADLWSIARVGIGSSTGLIGVVSLPRAFVFRINRDDPHPSPWLRVRLSCAIGAALYPDRQWSELSKLWATLYPLTDELSTAQRALIAGMERTMPEFVRRLLAHQPAALKSHTLGRALRTNDRTPAKLRADFRRIGGSFELLRATAPSRAMAILGQARADGILTPEQESRRLSDLLTYWALQQIRNVQRPARAARGVDCTMTKALTT
jgi:hypothetical protein